MSDWRHRTLTPYGRSVLAKSMLLSKLAHIHLVLPDLPSKKVKELEDLIYNFIWKTKHPVSRDVCKINEKRGGMNMSDIRLSIDSLKISWIRRAYKNPNTTWMKILNATIGTHNENLNFENITSATSLVNIHKIKTCNPFWNNCFRKLVTPIRTTL